MPGSGAKASTVTPPHGEGGSIPLRQAVFLDRDGTIAYDVNYCRRVEDLRLIPRAAEAVRLLNQAGLLVVVVTNQSGIARRYLTEETLAAIHRKMSGDLAREGAHVDGIYYCPHHPDDGCACRKPRPGMLKQATEDLNIDLQRSYLVGDHLSDVEAARAAGCQGVLVGRTPQTLPDAGPVAEKSAADLYEAVLWILEEESHTNPV